MTNCLDQLSRRVWVTCWLLPCLVAVVGLSACSEGRCEMRICDIRTPSCQIAAAESAACIRGTTPIFVPVSTIDKDDFVERRRTQAMTAEATDNQAFATELRGLALLKLAPPKQTPEEAAVARAGWVGAYYSWHDKAIVIVTSSTWATSSLGAVALLVHENVHALQDRDLPGGFAGYVERHRTSVDGRLASNAILEGEASLADHLAMLDYVAADDPDLDPALRAWRKSALKRAAESESPVLLAPLHFHYPLGASYVERGYRAKGWPAVDLLRAHPPSATRILMTEYDDKALSQGGAEESLGDVAVPVLPSLRRISVNDLGAWIFRAFLKRQKFPKSDSMLSSATGGGESDRRDAADLAAAHLVSDAYSIFRAETGGVVAVWRLRFSNAAVATRMAGWLAGQNSFTTWSTDRDVVVAASDDPSVSALLNPQLGFEADATQELAPMATAGATFECDVGRLPP